MLILRRKIKWAVLGAAGLVLIAAGSFYLKEKHNSASQVADEVYRAPRKIAAAGPFGTDVRMTERFGNCKLKLHTAMLYVKNTKTFGFDNALNKKIAAKDLTITLYRNDEKILSLFKAQAEMPLTMKSIVLKKPQLLYPDTRPVPDRVMIDKNRQRLYFYYRDRTEEVDLSKLT